VSPPAPWSTLLSYARLGARARSDAPALDGAPRTDFQRDFDRVVFSSAFRRLHDKTQVFPLPENDLVHSRLTHSLEVSCVGRSLGTMVGAVLVQRHPALTEGDLSARSFGDIVAAACLAHDIGNPPFGHAGEDAIGSWFKAHPETTAALAPRERSDLEHFEGNAQGFRILTRLQIPKNPGLQLTLATLAAFTKYPRESGPRPTAGGVAAKKHGFFQTERDLFAAVATGTGLAPLDTGEGGPAAWARHPLAYLVEAADDVCYCILDIEDGFRLGLVDFHEAHDRLTAIARLDPRFVEEAPPRDPDERKERISYLRAKAINRLIDEVRDAFMEREAALAAGEVQPTGLTHGIPSAAALDDIKAFTLRTCYRSMGVVQIELAGYNVLHSLLDALVPAVLAESPSPRQDKLLTVIPVRPRPEWGPYPRLLRVTDYLSGMTDSYAVSVFQRLTGVRLPR
jgi:dGTPase